MNLLTLARAAGFNDLKDASTNIGNDTRRVSDGNFTLPVLRSALEAEAAARRFVERQEYNFSTRHYHRTN